MSRHPHADLMIAYANDTSLEIEVSDRGEWCVSSRPLWIPHLQYRIKPAPKKVYVYAYLCNGRWYSCSSVDFKELEATRNSDIVDGTDVTDIKEMVFE